MGDWRRHAIYFAPPAGSALAAFGAAWLGWDPATGVATDGLALQGIDRDAVTAAPRRYGFHATLKPPFRLAGTVEALDAAAAAVAAGRQGFALRLRLAEIGRFLALVPATPGGEAGAGALADACVRGLDAFRAPAGGEELARRRGVGLDAEEEANLVAWGYPYVGSRFRFHMTLTGALPDGLRAEVAAALAPQLAPLLAEPVPVVEVCRFAEAADGRFRIVRRFPLGGGPG